MANIVSTHSHPKVAAEVRFPCSIGCTGFNTQPPEGGCRGFKAEWYRRDLFQHTATRRWLLSNAHCLASAACVSTHSHPKVAAPYMLDPQLAKDVSTHSHPKVAAPNSNNSLFISNVSTHSHPKVAAYCYYLSHQSHYLFQHTATRRWLLICKVKTVKK